MGLYHQLLECTVDMRAILVYKPFLFVNEYEVHRNTKGHKNRSCFKNAS
jgi:hypothetical protein